MKLPPNYAREWVNGTGANSAVAVNGWKVRIGNKAIFLSCKSAHFPGRIRQLLEKFLGIETKPRKTQDELIAGRERTRALLRRNFRNRLARGEDVSVPWLKPRTVEQVANEERSLDIAQKWQRMGEYRR